MCTKLVVLKGQHVASKRKTMVTTAMLAHTMVTTAMLALSQTCRGDSFERVFLPDSNACMIE